MGYFAYILMFALVFMTLLALNLHNMKAGEVPDNMPGGVTGAVVAGPETESTPMPLISWAVVLISMSLGAALIVLRHVHRASRYRN